MKPYVQTFWLLTLIPFAIGCSGYRLAGLPHDIDISREIEHASPVEAGNHIRVSTFSGQVYEGVVTEISSGFVEISRTNEPGKIVRLSAQEIAKLEVYQSYSPAASLGVASLVAGGLIGGYYLVQPNSGGIVRQYTKN